MHAVVIHEPGGPEVLHYESMPVPEPGIGEVRVRMRAAGLNHRDIWVRTGTSGPFTGPVIPGSDGAGEIDAAGPGVFGIETGKKVVILPGMSCGRCEACLSGQQPACLQYRIFDGTYAEYVVVPQQNVAPMPSGLTFTEAASIGIPFLTAEECLKRAQALPGQTLFLWGATGGLGVAILQLAKLRGVRVIAATRSAARADKLKQLHADDVLVWDGTRDVTGEVLNLTGQRGVDVVVDSLGQLTFAQSLAMARRGGVVVTVGGTTGTTMQCDLAQIFRRRLTILGAFMGQSGILPRLLPLFARGVLLPVIDHTYPLEQADQAHEQLQRGVFGKIVLEL
ncbi:MAG: zinc-binding dehydrogenase [Thermaerobacter sp.]|nr:zinc-binding dehydrogenase [Thermaerobacter sp.]